MSIKINRFITTISLSVSIFLAFSTFCFASIQIAQNPLGPDSYLHLSVGKFIVARGHIPTHADLSYKQTQNTIEWISHGWLSDLGMYLAYLINPTLTIPLILILLLSTCLLIVWQIIKLLKISEHNITLCILSLILLILPTYWQFHPFIFVYPLFLLTIYVILLSLSKQTSKPLFILPLLSFLWANLYGGYIFIFLLVQLVYLLYSITNGLLKKKSQFTHIRAQSIIFLLSLAASLLNPFGLKIYTFLQSFSYIVQVKRAFSSLPGFLRLINQNFLLENISTIPYAIYLVLFLFTSIFVIIAVFRFRKEYIQQYLALIPLTILIVMPLVWIRFIPFTLLGMAPLTTSIIYFLSKREFSRFLYLFLPFQVILLISSCFFIFFPYKTIKIPLPTEQLRIIKTLSLPLNYLISPEYVGYTSLQLNEKLNIDLYDDIFDKSETLNILIYSERIPRDILGETIDLHNASTILTTKEAGNMAQTLNSDMKDEWTLIYFDNDGFLFVRNDVVSDAFLKKYGMKYLDIGTSLGVKKEHINDGIKELEDFLQRNPKSVLARGQLATLYRITHNTPKAEQMLRTIPMDTWNYTVFTEMGRISASKGDCRSAETFFLRALDDRAEQNYSRAILDLAVVYAGCHRDKEKAKHFFERYLSFPLPDSEKTRAQSLAEDFGIKIR